MFPKNDFSDVLRSLVTPWYDSLKDPQKSQENVLSDLMKGYAKTRYGKSHKADETENVEEFQENFPVVDYKKISSYLSEVVVGNHEAFRPEPLVCWVMTRGSTGPAKVLPATRNHLEQIFSCGARALVNHVLRKRDFRIMTGKILNLSFPSNVHTMTMGGKTITYGYSSGTYAKLNPAFGRIRLLPRQEEIDSLGPGITKKDWERRFELAYQQAMKEGIIAVMGVTPVILSFARYVYRRQGKMPKELWRLNALFCTSVRKIQVRYAPILRKYFGQVPVIEIYSATEGVFAQQLDDLPYVTPNYDQYFFEVETGREVKMLHELERGEYGKLIISSCILPRYDIGDLIEAAGNNYFRVFGRNNAKTILEHSIYRLLTRLFL